LRDIESAAGAARTQFGQRDDYTSHRIWGGEGHENIFDVEDSLTAFLQFEDGKTASLETAWALNDETEISFRIRGIDGGAVFDLGRGDLTLYGVNREEPGALTTTDVEPDYADGVFDPESALPTPTASLFRERAFSHFLECVEQGEQPEHTGLDSALAVQRAIEDLYAAVDDADV